MEEAPPAPEEYYPPEAQSEDYDEISMGRVYPMAGDGEVERELLPPGDVPPEEEMPMADETVEEAPDAEGDPFEPLGEEEDIPEGEDMFEPVGEDGDRPGRKGDREG
jgi:hypothetical protein